ncbi:alpha/beta fold hydrolase [Streptomyces sp. NPDC096105]|uniref:alpha/beta fold hydrolase n=1 Tax=Streptomyces sp. NPDC096105 TaxID=3366074 RepID=UPI0037F57ACD
MGEPVLLLHGWPQTWRSWRHLMRPLADQGYTVIAPDLRGTGDSAHAEGGYSKDNQAKDMRQLLAALGVTGPVRLVGHDIGGMVAFSYARLFPQEVRRLALVELAVPGFGLERAMNPAGGGSFHFGLFMTNEVPELLFEGSERPFFQWWFPRLSAAEGVFTPEEIDAVTASYRGRQALRAGFGHYRTLLEDGRTNSAWADAGGRLDMPLLAVGGEHNVGTGLADGLRHIAPHVRPSVIEGSGHFPPEERPAALLEELTAFLA